MKWLLLTCFVTHSLIFADELAGPGRKILAADYSKKRLALISTNGSLEWEFPIKDIHDVCILPNSNILFQTSWTEILEITPEQKVVWRYNAAKQNTNGPVEVHSFQRLDDGRTLIAESGRGRLIEVDSNGVIQHQVALTRTKPDLHHDTRLARKLANGNYLVAHEGDRVVREYDPAGMVVWEYQVNAPVYSAVRLPNGNTLVGCGNAGRVVEVDPAGKVVWQLDKQELPNVVLVWVTMVDRLPNGNTFIVNCHAGPEQPQFIEVTPDKQVAWSWKDFKHLGNATPVGVLVEAK